MASALPLIFFENIFEHLSDDKCSLHSCVLVNRQWATAAVPILWRKPFHLVGNSIRQRSGKIVDALLTFLPWDDKIVLDRLFRLGLTAQMPLKKVSRHREVPVQFPPTFNYVGFIQRFCSFKVYEALEQWCAERRCCINCNLLLGLMFRVIVKGSPNLMRVHLDLQYGMTPTVEHLCADATSQHLLPMILQCAPSVVRGFRFMKLQAVDLQHVQDIIELIQRPRQLHHLVLDDVAFNSFATISDAIQSQACHLRVLHLRNISFYNFPLFSSLAMCLNLESLCLSDCSEIGRFSAANARENAFTRLGEIRFHHTAMPLVAFENLLCLANRSLRKIELSDMRAWDFNSSVDLVERYCAELRDLSLAIRENELYSFLCRLPSWEHLECLSILQVESSSYSCVQIDVREHLLKLANSMSRSVRHLEMSWQWKLDVDDFEAFLQACVGQRIKSLSILRVPFTDEHLNLVARHLGGTLQHLTIEQESRVSMAGLQSIQKHVKTVEFL